MEDFGVFGTRENRDAEDKPGRSPQARLAGDAGLVTFVSDAKRFGAFHRKETRLKSKCRNGSRMTGSEGAW